MEKQKINLPIDGKDYPVDIKFVQHRNKSESIFCWAILDNGKVFKMKAELTLLPKPDYNGHEWHINCHGMTTHTHAKERLADVLDMFIFHIGVANSIIEADRYVEVKVRIPKGKYCNSPLSCPLFNDGAGFEYQLLCQYLNEELEITKDEIIVKHKDCPAGQNKKE